MSSPTNKVSSTYASKIESLCIKANRMQFCLLKAVISEPDSGCCFVCMADPIVRSCVIFVFRNLLSESQTKRIYSFFTILFLGKVISIREFSINIFVVSIICSDSVDLLFLCSCSVELSEQVPPFRTLWLSNFKLTIS